MAKKKAVEEPKPAPTMVTCKDCGVEYEAGAAHNMFCSSKTCTECGTTYGYVISVYDSRPEAKDDDGNPPRLCDDCLSERMDIEEEDDEDL
jgi:hypothetical protein